MRPFAISATLPFGVVAHRLEDLSLDGPLAYVELKRRLGPVFWQQGHEQVEPDLPLARAGSGDTWYWCVSAPQGTIEQRSIHYLHRRLDTQFAHYLDFAGKRGKINTEGGPLRDARIPAPVLHVEQLTWYCLGDPAAVHDLAREITYLGKYHGAGEGEVRWEEPVELEQDWSVWRDGRLMRPIPQAEAEARGPQFEYEWRSLRPPHWDPTTQTMCAVRGHAG